MRLVILSLIVSVFIFTGTATAQLTNGTTVPVGQLEAVGSLTSSEGICSATLITPQLVLAAAHCVCPDKFPVTGCATRASFDFVNVFPVNNPATAVNESLTRAIVRVQGNVLVFPQFMVGGWLHGDYAVLRLDRRSEQVVLNVPPIPVERPDKIPKVGNNLTIVGFGRTGTNCSGPGMGKLMGSVPVSAVSSDGIIFTNTTSLACPGDSGGPAINAAGNVVGVASNGDNGTNSNYKPTYVAYQWIFGTGDIRAAAGRITMLRVHDMGTMYGPPTDPIDGEVVIKLDSDTDSAFGFRLRTGAELEAQRRMFKILQDAFARNLRVEINYEVTGPNNGRILRVIAAP
ncbi:MAG: S1 family peptidase [Pyrinomonadaceae bacterium]